MDCAPHSPETYALAWLGDALHLYHVLLHLRACHFGPSCSHDLLPTYTSERAQAAYVRQVLPALASFRPRYLSTLFEALYFADPQFRAVYCSLLLPALPTAWPI